MEENTNIKNPWSWIPALYFAEGFPYVIVNSLSVILYKELGVENETSIFWTSLLYLPWVIKPFWSPFVELKSTKRNWIFGTQLAVSVAFLVTSFTMSSSNFFPLSLACFVMAAFASATNDIATDGLYMVALPEKKQAFFMGIRSTFYRLASITGQGLIVVLAGFLEKRFLDNGKAWSYTMIVISVVMFILAFLNFFASPKIEKIEMYKSSEKGGFFDVFVSFFKKKNVGVFIAYILLFRLGESQILKLVSPFLLDNKQVGGLGLSTIDVGTIYGTFGVISLVIGGILGGIVISRNGLKKWILPMAIAMNLPNVLFLLLSIYQPQNIVPTYAVVIVEQFGYGFGVASFFMFMVHVANGISKTAHYAIATGFMGLGMMLPGMISGYLQKYLGYPKFFLWCLLAGIPALFLIKYLDIPEDFGKKTNIKENE